MAQGTLLRDFYFNMLSSAGEGKAPTVSDLKKDLEGLDAEYKRLLLLTPLSATTQENSLSYIISDGFTQAFSTDDQWRADFLKTVLDEIEKMTTNTNERLAMLTSANELGQTAFHKTLKYADQPELFDLLTERLYKWGGDNFADAWLKSFIDQSFGVIDQEISHHLQDLRDMRPQGSEDALRLNSLENDAYQPAEYTALKASIDKIRPLILEWLDKNPADPKASYYEYESRTNAALKAFAQDPDSVQKTSPFAKAFPGEMFFRLLDLQQKFDPKTPEQLADYIYEQLSKHGADGGTAMHRSWQNSVFMGPPGSPDAVTDDLAPVIAHFDKLLGEPLSLGLTKKLLLLENKQGALPLDNCAEYDGPEERDNYIGGFLLSLPKELGTQEKFKTYVTKVVAPILPPDFTIKLADYEPPVIDQKTGSPKPRRGAQIQP